MVAKSELSSTTKGERCPRTPLEQSPQYVYGIFTKNEPIECLYIGTTTNPDKRLQAHLNGINNPGSTKSLYFYCRQRGLTTRKEIELVVLQYAENDDMGDMWEDAYMTEYIRLGHPIQNEKRGNKSITKSSSPSEKEYKIANRRTSRKLDYYRWENNELVPDLPPERNNNLTKSEHFRARTLNVFPNYIELITGDWDELASRTKRFKWGDWRIYVKKKSSSTYNIRIANEHLTQYHTQDVLQADWEKVCKRIDTVLNTGTLNGKKI